VVNETRTQHKEKFNKKMQKIENIAILLFLFIFSVYYIYNRSKVNKYGNSTYAVVSDFQTNGVNMSTSFYYKVDDSIYKSGITGNFSVSIGDTITIKYLTDNPAKFIVIDNEYKK
jgi:hypothetical protein